MKPFFLTLLFISPLIAEPRTSNAPFLKPQEAVAKMEIAEDFEISVFASEPDIGEPIAFTFDHQGRIWTVENFNYTNRRSHIESKPLTRIQILEDTDGDGVFDSKKLFTDQLPFSSGIAIGHGGVFVGSPPYLSFIPDKNCDDQPDGPPEHLLDGWGIHDRHETLNSLIWGPDGWLYGCHGVFTSSLVGKIGAPDSERQFIDGGIWRYHPTKKDFEIFANGLSNPWGFDFNDRGQAFATCCVIPHIFHIVQGGTYHKQSKPHLNPYVYDPITTIRDHHHKSAHGGARFYLSDLFPQTYRDQLFMCNIHQHQVLIDVMHPKGSSFIASHGEDFLTTNDLAWVGFSVEIGPDGSVYILDWHDTDICGNAINFPKSGRIYRISPKGHKAPPTPNIATLSDLELVELQQQNNEWLVRQARLQLQMRHTQNQLAQKDCRDALWKQFNNAPSSPKRLRSLWALHCIGALSETELHQLLKNSDEYVRAFSIQFLAEEKRASVETLRYFQTLSKTDLSPVVRLYLSSALQRIPLSQRWEILANLSQHDQDQEDNNIPRMLWYALEPLVSKHPEQAMNLALGSKLPRLLEYTARRLASGQLHDPNSTPGDGPQKWQEIIHQMAPGFRVKNIGEGGVRKLTSFRNESAVQLHPLDKKTPCTLYRHLFVPQNGTTTLQIRASYHPHGDWLLGVQIDDQPVVEQLVSYQEIGEEWLNLNVDLTKYAGQKILVHLKNQANGWNNEFSFWHSVKITTQDSR